MNNILDICQFIYITEYEFYRHIFIRFTYTFLTNVCFELGRKFLHTKLSNLRVDNVYIYISNSIMSQLYPSYLEAIRRQICQICEYKLPHIIKGKGKITEGKRRHLVFVHRC